MSNIDNFKNYILLLYGLDIVTHPTVKKNYHIISSDKNFLVLSEKFLLSLMSSNNRSLLNNIIQDLYKSRNIQTIEIPPLKEDFPYFIKYYKNIKSINIKGKYCDPQYLPFFITKKIKDIHLQIKACDHHLNFFKYFKQDSFTLNCENIQGRCLKHINTKRLILYNCNSIKNTLPKYINENVSEISIFGNSVNQQLICNLSSVLYNFKTVYLGGPNITDKCIKTILSKNTENLKVLEIFETRQLTEKSIDYIIEANLPDIRDILLPKNLLKDIKRIKSKYPKCKTYCSWS